MVRLLPLLFLPFLAACGDRAPRDPAPFATVANPEIDESSGLAASRRFPGLFWTHNDSGDKARIFPLLPGSAPEGRPFRKGIRVKGAEHVDWETIALLEDGRLAVGDVGNNRNNRKDLRIYLFPEPDPYRDREVAVEQTLRFRYPDQETQIGRKGPRNFDCEAMFARNGKLFLLTKHRDDDATKLYRFSDLDRDETVPERIARFPIGGRVTGADASPDGKRVAVLTYDALWLFEGFEGDDIFNGKKRKRLLEADQCESVAFDGETLIVGNEEGELFRIIPEEMSDQL